MKVAKSRAVYIVVGLFFGLLGIHNFYAGYNGRGLTQLLISIVTGWLILPLFVVAVWVLAELFAVDRDASGELLT